MTIYRIKIIIIIIIIIITAMTKLLFPSAKTLFKINHSIWLDYQNNWYNQPNIFLSSFAMYVNQLYACEL